MSESEETCAKVWDSHPFIYIDRHRSRKQWKSQTASLRLLRMSNRHSKVVFAPVACSLSRRDLFFTYTNQASPRGICIVCTGDRSWCNPLLGLVDVSLLTDGTILNSAIAPSSRQIFPRSERCNWQQGNRWKDERTCAVARAFNYVVLR